VLNQSSKAARGGFVLSEVTRVPAVLHGVSDIAEVGGMCTLEVWVEQSSRGRHYIRCRITDDPPQLPDGEYRLEFDRYRLMTSKHEGQWGLSYLKTGVLNDHAEHSRDAA
jgi:hypothetical protein